MLGLRVPWPSVQHLLPHRGVAILLDETLEHSAEETLCLASIGERHPYLREGRVSTLLCIELFAQAAAVHSALEAQGAERDMLSAAQASQHDKAPAPVPGVLASAPSISCEQAYLLAGTRLRITVRPGQALGRVRRFEGEAYSSSAGLVARGIISVAAASPLTGHAASSAS